MDSNLIFTELFSLEGIETLSYLPHFLFIFEVLFLLWVGKKCFDWFTSYSLEDELVKKDNKAVAVTFAGYIVSLTVILIAVIQGESDSLLNSFIEIAKWGILGIALLLFAKWMNDQFLLRQFSNTKELIEDQNVGTGAVIAGSLLGSGILLHSILLGEAQFVWYIEILITFAYFLLAQVAFILFSIFYQILIGYDFHHEIEQDNIAAGISFGGNLIAIGIFLAEPLTRSYSIVLFAIWFVIGSSILLAIRYVLDYLLIPSESLDKEIHQDKNWGIALIEAIFSILTVIILIHIL